MKSAKYAKQSSNDVIRKRSARAVDSSSSTSKNSTNNNNLTKAKEEKPIKSSLIDNTIGGRSNVHHYETRSMAARRRSNETIKITRQNLKQLSIAAANGSHHLVTVNRSLSTPTSPVPTPTLQQARNMNGRSATQRRRGGLTHHTAPKNRIERFKLHVLYRVNKLIK